MDPLDYHIRSIESTRFRTKPSEYKSRYVTRNELATNLIGFHNCYLFVKVDKDDQPEKWVFSEYRDSANYDTASVFTREWSDARSMHVVVHSNDICSFSIVECSGDGLWDVRTTVLFNYEDFARMYTSRRRTSYEDPPVYIRDNRNALYKMWLNHIIRANKASPNHFCITEVDDIDRYDDLATELEKIVFGGRTDADKYDAIRKMVLNYDLISEEIRCEYFP